MKGLPSVWTTGNEELYAIDKVWPTSDCVWQRPRKKTNANTEWVPTPKEHP